MTKDKIESIVVELNEAHSLCEQKKHQLEKIISPMFTHFLKKMNDTRKTISDEITDIKYGSYLTFHEIFAVCNFRVCENGEITLVDYEDETRLMFEASFFTSESIDAYVETWMKKTRARILAHRESKNKTPEQIKIEQLEAEIRRLKAKE